MYKIFKKCITWTLSIIGFLFTLIPETLFEYYKLSPSLANDKTILINRIFVILITFILVIISYILYLMFRKTVKIKGENYCIEVKYGDIFAMDNCKKVIPFDECFTTSVGDKPSDINPESICGQYLSANPSLNIQDLISKEQLKTSRGKSKYNKTERYASGTIVQNSDYLLLAFAKLDQDGLAEFTQDEYINCLSLMWKELDKYYGQKDVCIPILGSGTTRIHGVSPDQQKLLDLIIKSYKLTSHKIKLPNKLYIICKKREGFSLNKISENI